jgi:hypothetical protein
MQSQIDALGESQFNRGAAIEAQRVLDRAMETARSARTKAGLFEQRRQQDVNPNRSDAVQIVKAINAQIEAEERQHQQRLIDIDRKAAEERRQQLVDVANDIAGILTSGLEQFDGTWRSVWTSMLDSALSVIRQIGAELMKLSLEGLLTGKTGGSSAGGIVGWLTNSIVGALGGGMFGGGAGAHGAMDAISHRGYAGAFADGGFIPPGKWGMTGERGPETVFGGRTGVTVLPNGKGQTVINKTTIINYQPRNVPNSIASRRSSREAFEGLLAFLK